MSAEDRKAYAALAVVCLVWGLSWVGTKEVVKEIPPLQMIGIRHLMAGSVYILYFMSRGHPLPRRKDWNHILLLSFLSFMVSNALAAWGVKLTTAGLSAILGAIFPLWLVIILSAQTKVKVSKMAWIGLLTGFAGVCLVFYEHLKVTLDWPFIIGIGLGLLASFAWAHGTIQTKKHAISFNPYHSIGWQMMISGIVLTTIANGAGLVMPLKDISMYTWSVLFFLVIVSSILAFLAYLYALQKLPTGIVSLYAYINPIVAVLTGSILIGEPLTFWIVTGSLVTLGGVYVTNLALSESRYRWIYSKVVGRVRDVFRLKPPIS